MNSYNKYGILTLLHCSKYILEIFHHDFENENTNSTAEDLLIDYNNDNIKSTNQELFDQLAEDICKNQGKTQKKIINTLITQIAIDKFTKGIMNIKSLNENDFHNELHQSFRIKATAEKISMMEDKRKVENPSRFWNKPREFVKFIMEDIDNYLISTELVSGQEPPTNRYEAQTTYGFIQGNIHTTIGMFHAIPTTLPSVVVACCCIGLTFLWSGVRKGYVRWLKTTPSALSPLSIYTDKTILASQKITGREDVIKNIFDIWNQKKHPILVGEPGTGKTSILMKLGELIAKGEYPEFKNKKMFGGSAASLTGNPGASSSGPFEYILKEARLYRENVIIALDEAHNLGIDPKKNLLQLLRTALDNSKESIRYCILATTPAEYKKYIQADTSLGRRLVVIEIESLSKESLLDAMYKEALEISPLLRINNKAMDTIFELTKGQHNAGRQLMHKVLLQVENQNQKCSSREKLNQKHSQCLLLSTEYAINGPLMELKETEKYINKINDIDKEIENLKKENIQEELELDNYKKLRSILHNSWNRELTLAKNLYQSLLKEKKVDQEISNKDFIIHLSNEENTSNLKEFLFLDYFLVPKCKYYIQKIEKEQKLISMVDEKLVYDVFEKENNNSL